MIVGLYTDTRADMETGVAGGRRRSTTCRSSRGGCTFLYEEVEVLVPVRLVVVGGFTRDDLRITAPEVCAWDERCESSVKRTKLKRESLCLALILFEPDLRTSPLEN
jgi:hypothetical protein